MSDRFELSPDFSGLHVIDDWPLCRVLLMDDDNYPWLVLVPRRPGLRDFHDLEGADLALATSEIVRASRALAAATGAEKMNVASLGNQTPQLHVHVIARFRDDPAWPGPVWGRVPALPWEDAPRDALVARFRAALDRATPDAGA